MTYITLDTRKTDRVALMTLHYNKENRFHPDFMAEIMETLDRAETDKDIGALVVTGGDSKFFSNGSRDSRSPRSIRRMRLAWHSASRTLSKNSW